MILELVGGLDKTRGKGLVKNWFFFQTIRQFF